LDDHDNQVDQEHFLKCRLFDVYIGDWDRHEDQWRWAGFKEGDGTVYRAVPRDRDQTFFLNEGVFPWISSRKFALRMNQGFKYDIKDMRGLIMQGKWLDRRFLSELSKKDWIDAAEEMQSGLTDEIITAAVYDMPRQIADVKGNTTIAKLKARRDQLPAFAEEYYSIISKKVDIVGSNDDEQFLVDRLNDDETEVKVWTLNSKGEKKDKIYDRTFKHDETREIRLYGLKGKDEFDVEGSVNKGMKVRIIGGPGKDDIKDKSHVRGLSKRTIIYDTHKKNDIEFGSEARDRTSRLPEKNTYTYAAFNYNKMIPLVFAGYNVDEALVIGAGFMLTTYGFQKSPYASHHTFGGRFASATHAVELKYDGLFTSVIRRTDLQLHLTWRGPMYAQNYFGMGNETDKVTDDKVFYHVRIGKIEVHPELSRTIGNHTFAAGIFYQKYSVERTPGRFISEAGLDPEIFETQDYSGINLRYLFDNRDSETLPTRGMYWDTRVSFNYDLDGAGKTFNQIGSDLAVFLSFRKPNRAVLAFRAGGNINLGNYEFFQASSVGGSTNLRGFRANRYSGDACVYQNSEFRFKLFNFSNYISKGEFGILAFNDVGRVWFEGEDSDKWHHGYGAGVWVSPFNIAVITACYERSQDERPGLFTLNFKFLF
ncbi:MAG: BamA/TamA family outer membrane protein, partial [Bacteroidales bacterium]